MHGRVRSRVLGSEGVAEAGVSEQIRLPTQVQLREPPSPQHEATLHLPGLRAILAPGSTRCSAGDAAHVAQEVARCVPQDQGGDQGGAPPTGAKVHCHPEQAADRPLQLLRCAWQLPVFVAVLSVEHRVCVQMDESAGWQA
jgi:hypothetical protein